MRKKLFNKTKNIFLAVLVGILIIVAIATSGHSKSSTGKVVANYQISDCFGLQDMNKDLAGKYVLMNEIDCMDTLNWNNETGFIPIGDSIRPFTGTFDGQGYSINFLHISRKNNNVGLFGYTSALAVISNVGIIGDVTGIANVGGIVGYNLGKIKNSYYNGVVIANFAAGGGIAGQNKGTIENCYSSADSNDMGADDPINHGASLGGITGVNLGTISNTYSIGTVSTTGKMVGGIAGRNTGIIKNSFSLSPVSGFSVIGSIVGDNKGNITNCFTYITSEIPTSCSAGANIGCTAIEDYTYFQGEVSSNQPMANWGSEWKYVGGDYPRLSWE